MQHDNNMMNRHTKFTDSFNKILF